MGNWHRVVGIDLGTTFSAVAAYNYDKNDVRIIPNRQNEPTTPSVVYIGQDGQVSVGRAAKEKLARDPRGVILEVKRLMGERSGDEAVTVSGRQEYEPELISAHILRELKAFAEKYIGEPIHDAVITVPAYFKESQRNATKEAARIAKLNPLLIINEPTAAAIAYAIDSGEKQTFIVYDLGGGTFDVSIVRANSERSFDVLGTGGDARLGGGDIDQKIVDWVLANIRRDHGRDLSGDIKTVSRMRLEAEKVKINICNEGTAQEFYLDNLGDGIAEVTYRLDVPVFEEMVRPILDKTLAQVDIALSSAKGQHDLTLDDVEAFILVGGSSKIPAVARVLKERYLKPIKSDLNPDEVVSIGAAWMGKGYTPSLGPEIRDNVERRIDPDAKAFADHRDVKDVVSHTLGVGLKDDVYDRLISKDTVIPFNVVRDGYTNAEDNQTTVVIPVYQGESSKASLNTHLGEVVIPLTPEPKGTHRFAITFGLDVNAIFKGEVKHHQTGKIYPIELDRGKGQITEKRRIDLADMVNQGQVPVGGSVPAGAPPLNPIEQLIRQATENLYRMPPDRQQEISALLLRLDAARKSNDTNEQAAIVAQLTMSLMRSQPAF